MEEEYISKIQEYTALFEHSISFICTWLTMYYCENSNIKFVALMDMWQHFIKIFRILLFGFELKEAPTWFCIFHSFFNYFSHNCVIILTCFVIFNLYAALKHPLYFAKYHKKIRPYVYIFTIFYIGIFIFASLFEPIFKPYSIEEISNRHNCSSAYRYKLYQYLLTSPLIGIPFPILSLYCTIFIIHKITVTPKSTIKSQVMIRTKMPLSRWIYILFISVAINVLSIFNLLSDINNGLHPEIEKEKLGISYYFTASTGTIIFLISLSSSQIKTLLDIKNASNHFDDDIDEISKNEIKANIIELYGEDIYHSKKNNSSKGSVQSQHSNYSRHSNYSQRSNYSRHNNHICQHNHGRHHSHSRNQSQNSNHFCNVKDSFAISNNSLSFINTSYNSNSKLIKNSDPSSINFNFPKEISEFEDLSQFIIDINSYVYSTSPENKYYIEQPNSNFLCDNKSPDLYIKSPDSYYFPNIPNGNSPKYIQSPTYYSEKSYIEQKSPIKHPIETPIIAHLKSDNYR